MPKETNDKIHTCSAHGLQNYTHNISTRINSIQLVSRQ